MKSIVFCTSQRFKSEMEEFIRRLRELAKEKSVHIVIFDPEFDDLPQKFLSQHEKDRLKEPGYRSGTAEKVYKHLFRKIKVADVCFIFNKDGYIGVNTAGELFAAAALGKVIYALEKRTRMGEYPDNLYEEPAPEMLIHEVVANPEELLDRLF
jgi:hypothetical protein